MFDEPELDSFRRESMMEKMPPIHLVYAKQTCVGWRAAEENNRVFLEGIRRSRAGTKMAQSEVNRFLLRGPSDSR